MTMTIIPQEIQDFAVSMSWELLFAACFGLAFAMLQFVKMGKVVKSTKTSKVPSTFKAAFKAVHSEASSGNAAKAITAWRAVKSQQAASDETLRVVAQALLDAEPASLATEIFEHFNSHSSKLSDSKAAVAILEVVANSGKVEILDSMFQMFTQKLRIPGQANMQEVLLGGYATAGNEKKVAQLVTQLREAHQKITVRGYSLMIKGFLKNGMLDVALKQIKEMHAQGLSVASFALTELFRVAQEKKRMAEIFNSVCEELPMTGNAATIVLEHCVATQDIPLAKSVEKYLRLAVNQMSFTIYEALVKVYTTAGDAHAEELFDEMTKNFPYISDGLCGNLISRCAEPKNTRFAEAIVAYLRSHSKMNLSSYVGLMRVYASCSMYSQACDLYAQIIADGLKPDSMMYGCLMKFSAECGRTDLTRELVNNVQDFDIHHHMALIRAAGQDKDVDMAFSVLEKLRKSEAKLDTVVCNAVLDVCSSVGDMKRARSFAAEMRRDGMIDTISYNTLLKGYSVCGDARGSKEVLVEMEAAGFAPNDISYNCVINMAASSGDFHTAWQTIETMERKGVAIDCYTVSTMMKALKNTQVSRDAVARVMSLLDRHSIDVCSEEVLLNTALEACIKHFEHKRLERMLAHIEARRGKMKLATHTYATLIRAFSSLKRVNRCRELWTEMTVTMKLEPSNVALGCILDALVCNGSVPEGVALFRKWQSQMEPSTVIYSTLIKGFANIRDNKSADELWQEFRKTNLSVNTMVFNAVIDAHARVGAMDEVTSLVGSMEAAGCKCDDITLSMVAKGYCVTGEIDKAMDVFRSLPGKANSNTVVVYNTILDGCVRHERADIADVLLANMEAWGIKPTNFTLGIIIKMWGNRHQLDQALSALDTLPKKYGFTPNAPVLTCLMFAALRNNELNHALNAFKTLRAAGHPADAKIFNALLNNCTRANDSETAVALVEEAYGLTAGAWRAIPSSEDLDSRNMDHLMKLLSRQGLMQTVGAPLIEKMRNAKVQVSPRLMSMALGEVEKKSARPWSK